jgi:hypothetical protein
VRGAVKAFAQAGAIPEVENKGHGPVRYRLCPSPASAPWQAVAAVNLLPGQAFGGGVICMQGAERMPGAMNLVSLAMIACLVGTVVVVVMAGPGAALP